MKQLINYLERIGFERPNSNYLFLKLIIESKEYNHDEMGMGFDEYINCKVIIKEHIEF